ncbi:MAG: hypothetical protein HOQ24_10055 [Mycobacteriaceae bacterium]|nr:hypothetical protein [Mycobacteriaceae bacterium]
MGQLPTWFPESQIEYVLGPRPDGHPDKLRSVEHGWGAAANSSELAARRLESHSAALDTMGHGDTGRALTKSAKAQARELHNIAEYYRHNGAQCGQTAADIELGQWSWDAIGAVMAVQLVADAYLVFASGPVGAAKVAATRTAAKLAWRRALQRMIEVIATNGIGMATSRARILLLSTAVGAGLGGGVPLVAQLAQHRNHDRDRIDWTQVGVNAIAGAGGGLLGAGGAMAAAPLLEPLTRASARSTDGPRRRFAAAATGTVMLGAVSGAAGGIGGFVGGGAGSWAFTGQATWRWEDFKSGVFTGILGEVIGGASHTAHVATHTRAPDITPRPLPSGPAASDFPHFDSVSMDPGAPPPHGDNDGRASRQLAALADVHGNIHLGMFTILNPGPETAAAVRQLRRVPPEVFDRVMRHLEQGGGRVVIGTGGGLASLRSGSTLEGSSIQAPETSGGVYMPETRTILVDAGVPNAVSSTLFAFGLATSDAYGTGGHALHDQGDWREWHDSLVPAMQSVQPAPKHLDQRETWATTFALLMSGAEFKKFWPTFDVDRIGGLSAYYSTALGEPVTGVLSSTPGAEPVKPGPPRVASAPHDSRASTAAHIHPGEATPTTTETGQLPAAVQKRPDDAGAPRTNQPVVKTWKEHCERVGDPGAETIQRIENQAWSPWFWNGQYELARRMVKFPDGQLCIVDANDAILATVSTNYVHWNGNPDNLDTWDAAADNPYQSGDARQASTAPDEKNTIVLLAMNVPPGNRKLGLPAALIAELRAVATRLNVEHVVSPFRPSEYGDAVISAHTRGQPVPAFAAYSATVRSDGTPVDPWLHSLVVYEGMDPIRPQQDSWTIPYPARDFWAFKAYDEANRAAMRARGAGVHPEWVKVTTELGEAWWCGETGYFFEQPDGSFLYREFNFWGEVPLDSPAVQLAHLAEEVLAADAQRLMTDLRELVQHRFHLETPDKVLPFHIAQYARHMAIEHNPALRAVPYSWRGTRDQVRGLLESLHVADFYGLRGDAEHRTEYFLMLSEVARLRELATADGMQPAAAMPQHPAGRDTRLEALAQRFTGSEDPYRLLIHYRRQRGHTERGVIDALADLNPRERRTYDDWGQFDPVEYAVRNYYGERVDGHWEPGEPGRWIPAQFVERTFSFDQDMILAAYRVLHHWEVEPESLSSAVEFAGASPIPGMLLAPFLDPGGHGLTQIVYEGSSSEQRYVQALREGRPYRRIDPYGLPRTDATDGPVPLFGEVISQAGREVFPGHDQSFANPMARVRGHGEMRTGNIFDHLAGHVPDAGEPPRRWDAVAAFYVVDSISADPSVMWQAVDAAVNTAEKFAVFGLVMNLPAEEGTQEGHGWSAGAGTRFPNTVYSRADWENYLRHHPRIDDAKSRIIEFRSDDTFSAGENGVALVMIKLH